MLEECGAPSSPNLLGATMRERATVRMWQRRVEQQIILPSFDAYRWGSAWDFFSDRGMHALGIPHAAPQRQATARDQLRWLDRLMAEAGSPDFICGDSLTLPDVQLFAILDWSANGGSGDGWWPDVLDDPDLEWVGGWFARCHARPSAIASDPRRANKL